MTLTIVLVTFSKHIETLVNKANNILRLVRIII